MPDVEYIYSDKKTNALIIAIIVIPIIFVLILFAVWWNYFPGLCRSGVPILLSIFWPSGLRNNRTSRTQGRTRRAGARRSRPRARSHATSDAENIPIEELSDLERNGARGPNSNSSWGSTTTSTSSSGGSAVPAVPVVVHHASPSTGSSRTSTRVPSLGSGMKL